MIDSFVKSQEGTAAQRLVPVNTGRIESANPKKRVDPLAYSQRFSDKKSIYGYMRQQLVSLETHPSLILPFSIATLLAS
jgi:hypothetical protein